MFLNEVRILSGFSVALVLLEHGWADICISDEMQEETFVVSYIGEDVLSKMIDTAINLANGQGSTIHFYLEPEEIPYQIKICDDISFELRIMDSVFVGSIKRYIRQVLSMFDTYLLLHSESEYHKQWGNEFPKTKLEQLRSLLQLYK
ncbi:MAG: hypothetical protein FWD25_10330 [Clostridia bacterium]|nr:hypothetical protein [Clostridia bacterium]